MTTIIRHILAVLALAAWVACMAASMSANIAFGLTIAGHEGWDPRVIGAATAASDVFKAITPIAGLWFLSKRWWWPMTASMVVLGVTLAYSTVAAIGFASVTRAQYSDTRVAGSIMSAGAVTDLDNLRKERGFLPKHRPPGVVENEIARVETERAWVGSDQCKTIEKWNRKFCQGYLELQAELAAGKQEQAINAKIAALEQRMMPGAYVGDADPQAKQLSRLSGMTRENVTTSLVLLMAALLEIGSSFGLTLAVALFRPEHGVLAEALAPIMPAMPEDPRKVSAASGPAPAPTFVGRGSTIAIGIKPAQPAPEPAPAPMAAAEPPPALTPAGHKVVRRFSLRPPFVHIEQEPARKVGAA